MAGMLISALLSVAAPIAAAILFRSRHGAGWKGLLVGALAFLVFSYYTAGILNSVVLTWVSGSLGADSAAFAAFLAAYSCLTAGIIDESSRFLCLRFVVKEPVLTDALMYGAGLGGAEAIVFTGMSSFGLWSLAASVNAYGVAETAELLTSDAPENAGEMAATITGLLGVNGAEYFAPGFGALVSVALHIALSVLVLMSARSGAPMRYYLMAMGLRALCALPDALYSAGVLTGVWPTRLLAALLAAGTALFVRELYKKSGQPGLPGKPVRDYAPRLR